LGSSHRLIPSLGQWTFAEPFKASVNLRLISNTSHASDLPESTVIEQNRVLDSLGSLTSLNWQKAAAFEPARYGQEGLERRVV
jgi:hypothetical protein